VGVVHFCLFGHCGLSLCLMTWCTRDDFVKETQSIPAWMFLGWTSQLLATLSTDGADAALPIVLRVRVLVRRWWQASDVPVSLVDGHGISASRVLSLPHNCGIHPHLQARSSCPYPSQTEPALPGCLCGGTFTVKLCLECGLAVGLCRPACRLWFVGCTTHNCD
jgi:hypothetical protein